MRTQQLLTPILAGLLILFSFSSCVCRSIEYRNFYSHLQKPRPSWQPMKPMEPSDYFLIILVDARHLDYTGGVKFFDSVAKHPSDGSKNRDVGHAWIYLQGMRNEQKIIVEGGHSGEKDEQPARYFDGLMNYNEYGSSTPTEEDILNPKYEPNPVKYLWTEREDGFFQKGSGGHRPTFAAKIKLTRRQFEKILHFIHPSRYPYKKYALLGQQCSSFVTQVAAIAGLQLASHTTMKIAPQICYGKRSIRLWEDPRYAEICFATPDMIEKSLIEAVEEGLAESALKWYLDNIEQD